MRSDIQRVEDQVDTLKDVLTRQDQERGRQLAEIIRLQQALADSVRSTRASVATLRGDVANDLYNIQQQLVQIQELTGQSQRRLSELRTQIERRGAEMQSAPTDSPSPGDGASGGSAAAPSADEIYETSLGQLRLGSAETARMGFRELLRAHPTSEKVPDALYYIGQSFETANADSALSYYEQVVRNYASSPRSASALYHVGLIRERANDRTAARAAYQRVVRSYPTSDEAALARDRLTALGS